MMQKLRERKRSEARAVAAKSGKMRRRKDSLNMRRVKDKEPEPVSRILVPKIRLPAALVPPEMVRHDEHRGRGHYDALDNQQPKRKKRRPRPIVVSAMRDFIADPIPLAAEPRSPEISDQPLF